MCCFEHFYSYPLNPSNSSVSWRLFISTFQMWKLSYLPKVATGKGPVAVALASESYFRQCSSPPWCACRSVTALNSTAAQTRSLPTHWCESSFGQQCSVLNLALANRYVLTVCTLTLEPVTKGTILTNDSLLVFLHMEPKNGQDVTNSDNLKI